MGKIKKPLTGIRYRPFNPDRIGILVKMAKEESRTLNSLLNMIVEKYLKELEQEKADTQVKNHN